MRRLAFLTSLFSLGICVAQSSDPHPQSANSAILGAFAEHDIVMLGEFHGSKQLYEWLHDLVNDPSFADRVDDIVVEFGNSLFQKSVDRYVGGEEVPMEQVQRAWRDVVGVVGVPSPVYPAFYRDVREANLKRKGKHQMPILLGGVYADWDAINTGDDLAPFMGNRDPWYANVVEEEVIKKGHRALLIMGAVHFLRRGPTSPFEQRLRAAGASTYLIHFDVPGPSAYPSRRRRQRAGVRATGRWTTCRRRARQSPAWQMCRSRAGHGSWTHSALQAEKRVGSTASPNQSVRLLPTESNGTSSEPLDS